MKNEVSREPRFFTAPEWINKEGPHLSGWPINKRALSAGRLNAGGTNMCKKLLARMDKAGRLK